MKGTYIYEVLKISRPVTSEEILSGEEWINFRVLQLNNYMGQIPSFRPAVNVKMGYEDEALYVIFYVKERFIRCISNVVNGPVWEDSCVEFFFSPDNDYPERYFNLEVNCGGTPLMHFNIVPRKAIIEVTPEDIRLMRIDHSLPETVDPEITTTLNWTVQYRIPFSLLRKYSAVTQPAPGVTWRANFYKTAGNNSNHHHITWSAVESNKPDFHLPQFFGRLIFR